jgi:hypothetical protein
MTAMKVTNLTVIISISFLFTAMSFLALSLLTKDMLQKEEYMNYAIFMFLAAMATLWQ